MVDLSLKEKWLMVVIIVGLLLAGAGGHAGYHAMYGHETPHASSSSSLTGCLDNGPHKFRLSNVVTESYSRTWSGDAVPKNYYRNIEETFDLHCTITHYDQRITEPEVKK